VEEILDSLDPPPFSRAVAIVTDIRAGTAPGAEVNTMIRSVPGII
jgi:hypothetical protein